MIIGELDKRVSIYTLATSFNNYGEATRSYSLLREVWAKIEWKGGFEKEEGDKQTGMTKVHMYIRDIDMGSLNLQSKIIYDSTNYFPKVINYNIEGRKHFIEIIAEHKD